MSAKALELGVPFAEKFDVIKIGDAHTLQLASGQNRVFLAWGTAPVANTGVNRCRIFAGVPEYFRVDRGDVFRAFDGITHAAAVGPLADAATVFRVVYDPDDGVVEIQQGAPAQ